MEARERRLGSPATGLSPRPRVQSHRVQSSAEAAGRDPQCRDTHHPRPRRRQAASAGVPGAKAYRTGDTKEPRSAPEHLTRRRKRTTAPECPLLVWPPRVRRTTGDGAAEDTEVSWGRSERRVPSWRWGRRGRLLGQRPRHLDRALPRGEEEGKTLAESKRNYS